MKLLALISSMPYELEAVLAFRKNISTVHFAGNIIHRGKLPGRDIQLMNTCIRNVKGTRGITTLPGIRDKEKWNLRIASVNWPQTVQETIKHAF